MTNVLTIFLPLLLASTNGTVEWLDDNRVKVSTTTDASDPNKLFKIGGKQLKAVAKEACTAKGLGKAKIEGEEMVTGISITPNGKRKATLEATYICQDS